MNELEAITTSLGEELTILRKYVGKARKRGSVHLSWSALEKQDVHEVQADHPILEALASLGYLVFRPAGDGDVFLSVYHITLLPAAFHRVDFEGKRKLSQEWQLFKLRYATWMGVAGFCISVVLMIKEVFFPN